MAHASVASAAVVTQSPVSIETLLFDLDGTLYPIENGYEDHVRYYPDAPSVTAVSSTWVSLSCKGDWYL